MAIQRHEVFELVRNAVVNSLEIAAGEEDHELVVVPQFDGVRVAVKEGKSVQRGFHVRITVDSIGATIQA